MHRRSAALLALILSVALAPGSGQAVAAPVPAAAAGPAVPAALAAYVGGDRTGAQWSLAATRVPAAWAASTGVGVTVAVIDTGVDRTRPDLAGKLVSPAYLDPVSREIVAGYEPDRDGHGTHVAGIIAARADGRGVTGVAPGARIMPIDVDTTTELDGVQVARAVRWAVAHGARVVNLSLGEADIEITSRQVAPLCAAVAAAAKAGVVVVAAAGNDGAGLNLREAPATCRGALPVAAVNSSLQPAVWSSFDAGVSVAAPGDDVYSTVPTFVSRTGFTTMSGTSMAAPFVAGVVALMLSRSPSMTPAQVRARLEATASDVAPAGRDPRTGHGVVDPAAALGVPAGPPAAVPHLTIGAVPYPARLGPDGEPVFDSTYVNWVPDPALVVSGYRLTSYTARGVTSVALPADRVRHVVRVGEGGWTITAQTPTGRVTSAPVWSSVEDTGQPPAVQMAAPERLSAQWDSRGSLVVTWRNPARNGRRADRWSLAVDDVPVRGNERPGAVPTRVVLPAGELPAGDLRVSVVVGSTRDQTDAEAGVTRPARVPFSGRAVRAGAGRYRVYLVLAPSWARRACGRQRCVGQEVTVVAAGRAYRSWVDGSGTVTASVVARAGVSRIGVRVRAVDRRHRLLDMPAADRPPLPLPVG